MGYGYEALESIAGYITRDLEICLRRLKYISFSVPIGYSAVSFFGVSEQRSVRKKIIEVAKSRLVKIVPRQFLAVQILHRIQLLLDSKRFESF